MHYPLFQTTIPKILSVFLQLPLIQAKELCLISVSVLDLFSEVCWGGGGEQFQAQKLCHIF